MSAGPRAGDFIRAAILVAAGWVAIADGVTAALALVLIVPPALALRLVPVSGWLDAALCVVLVTAQLGALAGLTETTAWWDGTAHAVAGALLLLVVSGQAPGRRRAFDVAAVAALAGAWEGLEWASDMALATNFSPGAGDTVRDFGLSVAGAGVAAVSAAAYRRRRARLTIS